MRVATTDLRRLSCVKNGHVLARMRQKWARTGPCGTGSVGQRHDTEHKIALLEVTLPAPRLRPLGARAGRQEDAWPCAGLLAGARMGGGL